VRVQHGFLYCQPALPYLDVAGNICRALKGGDIRRAARVALSGVAARNERTTRDDMGHVRLGGDRPKYKPLNERRVEVKPIARPVPRYEFEPPPSVGVSAYGHVILHISDPYEYVLS